MLVGPRVVADRLDRVEHEPRPGAVRIERPQPLRRVGLDADDGEALAIRERGRGVLALARRREPDARLLVDVVTVDIRLTVLADRRIEERATVGEKERLVVVAGPGGHVDRCRDRDATLGDAQASEVDVRRRWTL